jgi:hypothetical protein
MYIYIYIPIFSLVSSCLIAQLSMFMDGLREIYVELLFFCKLDFLFLYEIWEIKIDLPLRDLDAYRKWNNFI